MRTLDEERRLELLFVLVDQLDSLLVAAAEHVSNDNSDVLGRALVLQQREVFGVLVGEVAQQIADESTWQARRMTTCREWTALRPDCRGDGNTETLEWSSSLEC